MCLLSLQPCLTLCDPMDFNLPGSSVHGILQARILEWVAMPSSRGFFPTQGSNPSPLHLLHCRRIFRLLSHGEAPGRYWEVTLSWKGMQYTGGIHGDAPNVGLQVQAAPLSKRNRSLTKIGCSLLRWEVNACAPLGMG